MISATPVALACRAGCVIALLVVFQAAIGRPIEGLVAGVRLVAVAVLAIGVTLTTRFTEMAEWLERTLRRLRVPPSRVFRTGVTVGLDALLDLRS